MKFTRDSALWWLLLIAGAATFLGGHFDLLRKALGVSDVWQARIELISACATFLAGYLRMSPLALSKTSELASAPADSTRTLSITGKASVMLLAAGLSLFGSACSTHEPPKGLYSPTGEKAYRADALIKDLTAISQTAINLNATQGQLHLHDRDTAYVREFALVAGAALKAYGQGATTLETARQAVAAAQLPPGIPAAARAAFDKAVADHGAGASVLYLVVDAYRTFRANLSPDAIANPRLLALLNAIDTGIQSIPLQ